MGAKVGGVPLLLSMVTWKKRDGDKLGSWLQDIKTKHSSKVLRAIEIIVIGGVVVAFILPVFNS
jgi:hypothetical protein